MTETDGDYEKILRRMWRREPVKILMTDILNDAISRDQLKWISLNHLYRIAKEDGDEQAAAEYQRARSELAKTMEQKRG
jgi:hypothetical protein